VLTEEGCDLKKWRKRALSDGRQTLEEKTCFT
jgi:hypothetical protein